ncbi:MAG: hypothetical protein N2646_09685, partial [Bellilinea sp.]|nr:hypothetical protein [Bellilinea sp.]
PLRHPRGPRSAGGGKKLASHRPASDPLVQQGRRGALLDPIPSGGSIGRFRFISIFIPNPEDGHPAYP